MEPLLDATDIQGHVFPGFGTSHSVVIALQLRAPAEGRAALGHLLPEVTTMADSLHLKGSRREAAVAGLPRPMQQIPLLALSIAATALRAWGHDTSGFDLSFHMGMRADAASLGDPIGQDSIPVDWTFETSEDDRVDVLLIAGHSERVPLEQAVERWLSMLAPHWTPVLIEYGRRRAGDKEFFGFKDGISQPAMRGVTPGGEFVSRRVIAAEDPRSELFAKPGQLLIWPGSFLFGYPCQTSSLTQPGAKMPPPVPWMRNGSYLVFRRLLQNVRVFREAVTKMEQHLMEQGENVPEGWVSAHLVGRWPDGTPLTASPENADPDISDDQNRINNFRFFASLSPTPLAGGGDPPETIPAVPPDPLGFGCPRASHIRQVNPRDGISEIGQEHHSGKLMLRRGIAFGPEEEEMSDADRGLLFLSYQTSIVEQFKFVQVNWANATQRPTGDGADPIIGQNGTLDNERRIQLFSPSRRQQRCPLDGRWVVATGGGYFVVPSIGGLRHLLHVDEESPS
ncbi:Dyp-type peroxidase [Halomonas heilongjiangensis]|uniref:Peroxidase n=1 Tax=Halomonas heilongjiangensis TaxID=1387883 RepID=A0A2N7TM34_9GAMM|nr:Dyp-type peroxidase [Halomonas heilongjiangensis]PMR69222.1 hypothetical protein C1H66_11620 [Halomonas heilongjiangensis]PXX87413.1 hypothetical protein CR158_18775 [Halomonas heilongjiangensis]